VLQDLLGTGLRFRWQTFVRALGGLTLLWGLAGFGRGGHGGLHRHFGSLSGVCGDLVCPVGDAGIHHVQVMPENAV
jgi:hypothetical protein